MTYPALIPSTRVFSPGNTPQARQTSLSGMSDGFRRGNRRIGQMLQLSYLNLVEADFLLLKAHYIDRQGTYDIFFLSTETWNGMTTPPVPLLSDYAWKYSAPLVVSHASCDRYNVEVQLETQPIDLSDLIIDGGLAGATPVRDYIVDGGLAAATPARTYVISPGGAA
jgi:hypothetical protein